MVAGESCCGGGWGTCFVVAVGVVDVGIFGVVGFGVFGAVEVGVEVGIKVVRFIRVGCSG